jgi:arabinan endo-1,5-alpha-L-arabinosidase
LARAPQVAGTIKGCHDPSRITYADGRYWVFSTAENLNLRWSLDLENWQWAQKPFSYAEGVPGWMVSHLRGEGNRGRWNLWAPDIIKSRDKYLLFYSRNCRRGADERSVCGVAVSTSLLNPNWVDQGAVLDIKLSETHYRVIDPAPVFDVSGRLWLAVGSFGSPDGEGWRNGGIRVFEISPATGKLIKPDDNGTRIAGSWIEAPHIHYRSGYYYLFFNEGQCCRGLHSTYFIRMGRSQRITGPYVDKEGNDLRHRGGSLFMGVDRARNPKADARSSGREIGPGHVGIFTVPDGTDVVTYHFYDGDTPNGEPTLGMRIIRWGNDGWPSTDR